MNENIAVQGSAGTLDGEPDVPGLVKLTAWGEQENEAYVKKVKEWNSRKSSGTQREFLEFLELDEKVKG